MGSNKSWAAKQVGGKEGLGQHSLDATQQGGLLALANPQGLYGRTFGAGSEQGTFGDFNSVDPGGYMAQENPAEVRKQKQLADTQGRSQGQQARQMSIASGTGGGGIQHQTDSAAYNRVLEQYAALRQALEMQRQQHMMSGIGNIFSMFGMMGGGQGQGNQGTPGGYSTGSGF